MGGCNVGSKRGKQTSGVYAWSFYYRLTINHLSNLLEIYIWTQKLNSGITQKEQM